MWRLMVLCLVVVCSGSPVFSADLAPADYVDPTTGMEFVAIPTGSFVMGDNADMFAQPEHEVTVKAFLLGRFEVTFAQYLQFCKATGRSIPADEGWGMNNRPVINVSWQDAVDFTKWLSKKTGRTFRLPSESEWEYAARGKTTTNYPWGNEIGVKQANCFDCGSEWDGKMTAPVGSFPPNGFGLFDMIGNVYEWCLDRISKRKYEGAPVDGSAQELAEGTRMDRINRGGSWKYPSGELTVFRRCWDEAASRTNYLGFRVLLEP